MLPSRVPINSHVHEFVHFVGLGFFGDHENSDFNDFFDFFYLARVVECIGIQFYLSDNEFMFGEGYFLVEGCR
jgi:hypothetical protein